ncbi:lipase/ esterase [Panus rudis PR-1116 ss-1]|nr:lipase/ esterase [Panus rudis PR-1116 ss-1]
MAATQERKQWQPIHPDFLPKLLPEYIEHHNNTTLWGPSVHQIPWDPSFRQNPPVAGGSTPLKVGSVQDYSLSKFKVRVFTPEGTAPDGGWPVFIYFHGGGWCLGNIDTENAFSSNACKRADCVVVSVDYRLGPEDPYPAAVEDAEEALKWVYHEGKERLNINPNKIAVGGSSSGGNLAAIVTHKAALLNIPLVFQVLIVPVVDNTASPSGEPYASWRDLANTPALPPEKMMWFRTHYSPNEADWKKWDSSPIFAPDETFKKVPDAWVGVAELDILRDEGLAYAEKLKKFGHQVEIKIYKRAPHPIMAQDGVLQVGRQLVTDAVSALAKAFGNTPKSP